MERIEIREDLENLYHWDRIESTFETIDGVETLTRSLRLYDDGTSKAEEISASGSVILYQDNPVGAGIRPWYSIEIRLDTNLQRESRTFQFDDGTFLGESYLDGIISSVFQSDGNGDDDGVEPWSQIETRFDSDGQLASRLTIYDDGTFLGESYLDGIISSVFQSDGNGDDDGAEPWSHIEARFDPGGQLASRLTIYDDGTERHETYENGVLRESFQIDNLGGDHDGVEPWYLIETYFDQNAQIVSRGTLYDDGTTREETYENGVLRSVVQYDNPGESHDGVELWSGIYTSYDENRVIERRDTIYDDGTRRDEVYENGILRESIQYDNPSESHDGVEPWSIIETRFDQDGRLVYRGTVNDDGTLREETYENGTIRTIVQYDNPTESHDGVELWSRIYTTFDENGQRTSKTVTNDDGSQKIETFLNGVRTRVEVAEERPGTFGGPVFEVIFAADYDPNTGALITRQSFDADGNSRVELFENGERVSSTLFDGNPDANAWRTIEATFTDGNLSQRTTAFDNGDQRVETFVDGSISSIVDSDRVFLGDPPNFCDFMGECPDSELGLRTGIDQREMIFGDDGLVAVRRTLYTDGDQTAALYENNRIYEQQLFDGDGDQPWLARSIFYDTSGAITDTIEFQSEAEIPLDFFVPTEIASPDPGEAPSVGTFSSGESPPSDDTFANSLDFI